MRMQLPLQVNYFLSSLMILFPTLQLPGVLLLSGIPWESTSKCPVLF